MSTHFILDSLSAGGGWPDILTNSSNRQQQLIGQIGFGEGMEKVQALIELAETVQGRYEPKVRMVDGMLVSREELLLQALDMLAKDLVREPECADVRKKAYLALATFMPADGKVRLWDGTIKTREELIAFV